MFTLLSLISWLCVGAGLLAGGRRVHRLSQLQQQLPPYSCSALRMSDGGSDGSDRSLLDQMRRSLGETEDVFGDAQAETRQLMKGLRDLDRDPNLKANNKFIEWLASNGVWVKQESAWGRAPHPLVISSQTEDDGETCGRGLLARESMGEGELMMTIPLDLCLTRAQAQLTFGKEVIPDDMDEYIAISLLLMSEKLKGANSRWKPYFDVLPDAEEVYPSYIWTDAELEMLRGSPVYSASRSLRSKLEKEYAFLAPTLERFPALFPRAKFTYELFLWSFVMLFSRAARLSSKTTGEELALVPYADLMNHNPYSNTYIDAQRSGMPLISRTEEVRACLFGRFITTTPLLFNTAYSSPIGYPLFSPNAASPYPSIPFIPPSLHHSPPRRWPCTRTARTRSSSRCGALPALFIRASWHPIPSHSIPPTHSLILSPTPCPHFTPSSPSARSSSTMARRVMRICCCCTGSRSTATPSTGAACDV